MGGMEKKSLCALDQNLHRLGFWVNKPVLFYVRRGGYIGLAYTPGRT